MSTKGFLAGAKAWLYQQPDPDRCPACDFDWSITPGDALAQIETAPRRYEALLDGRDGMVPATQGWNATSYVWHLADLSRSWSERWVLLAANPGAELAGWDPDDLAAARNYVAMPKVSALWALSTSVQLLVDLSAHLDASTPFQHGEWGEGTIGEALVWLAHEFVHHEVDVSERAVPKVERL